ncbi:MAG: PLP-dependent aminotransferase family protein [Eggerthellaceae bacterium]|nr:PLP-dependent aminotransferase family protein [Eggerthellaceae bacterium]
MHIDPELDTPLYLQIYEQCKKEIVEGVYPAGEKLPPIRKLADELGVARNTVESAYRQLGQEGFVASRSGSGFMVERLNLDDIVFAASVNDSFGRYGDHERASLFAFSESAQAESAPYDFSYGNLADNAFPVETWRKLTTDTLYSTEIADASRYNDSMGDFLLRLNITNHLRKTRGVHCFPQQVVIQAGTQAALQNLLMLFDPERDKVAVEDPGYDEVRRVFANNRFEMVPCPVCKSNRSFFDALAHSGARLAFTTPSNQFPTGQIMPVQSRQHLLDWARTNNAYVIEDDYCREFRHNTRPVPSLQSLDTYHRVIYLGTFSKVLSPALRMSYLILPPALLEQWANTFRGYHSAVPWLSQAVLRRFMERGYWDKLLRRAQTHSRRKRDVLIGAIKDTMGGRVNIMESGAGLHLLLGVRDERGQHALIAEAEKAGVRVYETERYWMEKPHPLENYVLVGFSAIDEEKIAPGIACLAKAWFG